MKKRRTQTEPEEQIDPEEQIVPEEAPPESPSD